MTKRKAFRGPVIKDCTVPGCREVAQTKGLCHKHYQAMRKAEKKAQRAPLPSEAPRT